MRIEIKPPSPAPPPPPRPGALVTLRVETSDPPPVLSGPPLLSYEGRYVDTPAPGAFLFPASGPVELMTATAAHSDFRLPVPALRRPYVDIPLHAGDVITATLTTPDKTYAAALRAPTHGNDNPVELTLAEGAAAPPPPQPPGPNPPPPQPAEGLTITPLPPPANPPGLEEGDVVRLDTAPGADNLIVLVPAP